MEFHISGALRRQLQVDETLFSYTGNVVFANVAAARKLAARMNEVRRTQNDPERIVHGAALFAMGLIDELSHALIAQYRKNVDPGVLAEGVRYFQQQLTPEEMQKLLMAFTREFPNTQIFRGELTVEQWLAGRADGLPNREAAFEELVLLWLANANPAFRRFRELFDDDILREQTRYKTVAEKLPEFFVTRPPLEIGTLLDVLTAPLKASPDSLTGQLEFIRERWAPYLGEDMKRILLAVDVLREEEIAVWMRFNPAAPDNFRHGAPGGIQGFEGDEYMGFEGEWELDAQGRRRRKYAYDYQAPLDEYERFSADREWMPNVVLMAKSTYVWLEQLSKKYQRHIHRLDHIPNEELQLLAERGITGLWLIGLWERSRASQTIKRLRGHGDAVASAYSLEGYEIAYDLGGHEAYLHLRERAAHFGLRLASDMVPNHMGLDSRWVIEHPDWFLTRWESPYPSYSFNGPDLSADSRVEIKIEDHYYDQTDAAVAYRVRWHGNSETRYIYHGNDGTSFAWNDTAQLDYSKAYVREQVIQVILDVARRFPIIRFDAAMVLAKRHVQRLWFPLPGAGGSIPSRAEYALSQEEFDAIMPTEFWRDVVDRVEQEVPGTLLLAEAFWLLEGYFVRTLGMHRVYNSAFMVMLRDEENAKYRSYLKKTIEFDPDIMKRYVNFMSNPDEKTAIDQFGTGDKFFGVSVMLATLPGLPMFGHGQIEGYTERYGMEFKRARMDENPNEWLIERHQREIAPLLKRRPIFAESYNFVLYDFWTGYGTVDENVFAYSNRRDGDRSLVLYNNTYGSTRGTIHVSAAFMDKGAGEMRQRRLHEGLAMGRDGVIAWRDQVTGLEYLKRGHELHDHGLTVDLRGFQYMVLLEWREMWPTEEWPWDRLCDVLQGRGVPDLNVAMQKLRLGPLHDTLRWVADREMIEAFAHGHANAVSEFVNRCEHLLGRITEMAPDRVGHEAPSDGEAAETDIWTEYRERVTGWADALLDLQVEKDTGEIVQWERYAVALLWSALEAVPVHGSASELFDRLQLRAALGEGLHAIGLVGEAGWRVAAAVRVLLEHGPATAELLTSESLWRDADVEWLAGVNEHNGVSYVNREQFVQMVEWLTLPAAVVAEDAEALAAAKQLTVMAEEDMAVAGYDLEAYLQPIQACEEEAVAPGAAPERAEEEVVVVAEAEKPAAAKKPRAKRPSTKPPAPKSPKK